MNAGECLASLGELAGWSNFLHCIYTWCHEWGLPRTSGDLSVKPTHETAFSGTSCINTQNGNPLEAPWVPFVVRKMDFFWRLHEISRCRRRPDDECAASVSFASGSENLVLSLFLFLQKVPHLHSTFVEGSPQHSSTMLRSLDPASHVGGKIG